MNIGSIGISLWGMQANQNVFQNAAHRIAQFGTTDKAGQVQGIGLEQSMVEILTSRRGYQANLQVLKAADEMLGTLLDTFA